MWRMTLKQSNTATQIPSILLEREERRLYTVLLLLIDSRAWQGEASCIHHPGRLLTHAPLCTYTSAWILLSGSASLQHASTVFGWRKLKSGIVK